MMSGVVHVLPVQVGHEHALGQDAAPRRQPPAGPSRRARGTRSRPRSHALRHGAATYALAAGLDIKIVSARLGHSTSALTRDVYTSVLPDVARVAAETTAAMIPRRRAHP